MPYHAMARKLVPHHTTPSPRHITQCHTTSRHVTPCQEMSRPTTLCQDMLQFHTPATQCQSLSLEPHTLSLLLIHPYPTGNAGDLKLHTVYLLPPLHMMPASLLCLTVALWWPLMQRNSAFIAFESINSCNDLTLSLLDVASPVVTLSGVRCPYLLHITWLVLLSLPLPPLPQVFLACSCLQSSPSSHYMGRPSTWVFLRQTFLQYFATSMRPNFRIRCPTIPK